MSPAVFRAGLSYAQELDRRFGRKTIAAKMTDVPGHTLGMVPLPLRPAFASCTWRHHRQPGSRRAPISLARARRQRSRRHVSWLYGATDFPAVRTLDQLRSYQRQHWSAERSPDGRGIAPSEVCISRCDDRLIHSMRSAPNGRGVKHSRGDQRDRRQLDPRAASDPSSSRAIVSCGDLR